ncbi:hypothetical protein [Paenibacillus sp. FSL R5-0345]|nr:hypothetical protein [Paenibacillus sp. FSL R5-0345]
MIEVMEELLRLAALLFYSRSSPDRCEFMQQKADLFQSQEVVSSMKRIDFNLENQCGKN